MGKTAAKRRKEEKKERKKLWNEQKEAEKKQEVIPEQAIQPEKSEVQMYIPAVPIDEQKKEAPIVPEKIEKKEEKKGTGGKKETIRNMTVVEPGVQKYDFTRMATSGAERLVLKESNAKNNELYRMDSKFKAKDKDGNVLRFPVVIDAEYFAGDEIKLIPATRNIPAYYYVTAYLINKGHNPKVNINLRDGVKVSADGKIRGMAELGFLAIGGTKLKIPYMNIFPFEDGIKELYSSEIGIIKPTEEDGCVIIGPSANTYHVSPIKGKAPIKVPIEVFVSLHPIAQ